MNMTQTTLKKMARMHANGASFDAIGAEYGISGSWARTQLIQAGLHTPASGGTKTASRSGGGRSSTGRGITQRRQPTGAGRRQRPLASRGR